MLSRRIELQYAKRLVAVLALGLAMVGNPASAADSTSSPRDRARFVSITRAMEAAPLKPTLKADRDWALQWLTDAPDISVAVCADPLNGMVQGNYVYGGEILIQYMFSIGASIIEHPDTANDRYAQQLAGVESALVAYQAILKEKPEVRSPALDGLLQTRAQGKLSGFVRKAFDSCLAKESESQSN